MKRPAPERLRLLQAVAAAHDSWVGARLRADDTGFTPRGADSDYNQHHVDVEATAEQSALHLH